MNDSLQTTPRQLVASTVIALSGAVLILVLVVLPAEYGVDPTGVGGVLGFTSLGEAKRIAANTRQGVPMHPHDRQHRSARVVIELRGREELEYKAELVQGEPLLYSWRVTGGPVYSEFHGEPTEGDWPKGFFQRYQTRDRSVEEHGSFVAPFTGRHGWYWRNLSDAPAAITLETSGYYSKLGRIEGGSAPFE
jgi:hypothetical protein